MSVSRRRFLLGLPFAVRALGKSSPRKVKAVERGLGFLYRTARDPRYFKDYGDDLLWSLYSTSRAAADAGISREALRLAEERGKDWRRRNTHIPDGIGIDDLCSTAYGYIPVELMGMGDPNLKEQIRRAVGRFTAIDFLGFDPKREGVPADIPHACEKCGLRCARGVTVCTRCGTPLQVSSPYDVLCDALITTYNGQLLGIELGAAYSEVLRCVPPMRPYKASLKEKGSDFYPMAYCVTHVIYTLNDYTLYRLRPESLPHEYEFLRSHLRENIEGDDPETLGEFVDTLKSFGVREEEPLLREAIEYLLPRQNRDGSWGDPKERDIYVRYHTTWTVIGALLDYSFVGEKPVPGFMR